VVWAGQVPCYDLKKDSTKKDSLQNNKGQECFPLPAAKKLTEGNFTVGRFAWNPDGNSIAFVRQPDPLINSSVHSAINSVDITSKKITTLVAHPSADFLSAFSPDGKSLLYDSDLSDTTSNFYKNSHYLFMTWRKRKNGR
jgi:WD40 repeat protein